MADHEERYLSTLRAFVLRARRIRAHSLSKDAALLQKLLNPSGTIQLNPENGETTLTWNLPPEEQVESAAARVRPLILNDEVTYHAKVMNAISYFANKANLPAMDLESIRVLKQQWAKVNPKAESNGFYEVRVQMKDDPETQIGDNALAFSWIYGDVVHADPERRAKGQVFGVDERYRAAVPVVVRLLMLGMTTLTFIETLHTNGTIPDLGDVFTEDVVYDEATSAIKTRVYLAEYREDGTLPETPAMGEEFGQGWQSFQEVFGSQVPPQSVNDDEPEEEQGA